MILSDLKIEVDYLGRNVEVQTLEEYIRDTEAWIVYQLRDDWEARENYLTKKPKVKRWSPGILMMSREIFTNSTTKSMIFNRPSLEIVELLAF